MNYQQKPSPYDVICGRGKGSYNMPGNKRFRAIVTKYVGQYQEARSKLEKTVVLERIIETVEAQNNHKAYFLKHDSIHTGMWCRMSLDEAREKVGHAIREAIQNKDNEPLKQAYKSIIMMKQAELLKIQQQIYLTLSTNTSTCSSDRSLRKQTKKVMAI
jgi:hypothetical protein